MVWQRVNREVCPQSVLVWEQLLPPPDIKVDCLELFRIDGVHLSDLGLELILANLKRGLLLEVQGVLAGMGLSG